MPIFRCMKADVVENAHVMPLSALCDFLRSPFTTLEEEFSAAMAKRHVFVIIVVAGMRSSTDLHLN